MSFSEKLSNSYLWEKRKLVEITKKIGSGATPRGGKGAYKERGIPFIRSQNIYNCKFNSDGLVYINDEQAVKLNNVKLEKNDVLINITGDSVARCTKLPNEFIDGRVNQHVAIIRCNEKFIDSDYLKYYLVNKETQMFLLSLAGSGATRAALTKSMLENIEISLPYIEEQKAIAKILSDLDEKIEVNNKINKNLEEMAQAIFKQWFVDFEFPNEEGKPYKSSGGEMVESELGMIPKGWKIFKLGDFIKFIKGKKPKKIEEKFFDGCELYLTIDVLNRNSEIFANKDKIIEVNDDDILMVMDGASSGSLYYGLNGILGSTLAKISVLNTIDKSFLYYYLKLNESSIKSHLTGSAIPHTDKEFINKLCLAIPNDEMILKKADTILNNIRNHTINLNTECSKIKKSKR
ncbi:restriction endonuclease subunit S [Clostridium perfringens]|uniref:restriction endonuclease subunit S n=1 Tax=Clostridium perfringens TaxID=1502 RepID=UPI00115962F7|nr:restriction endonuclease subunit S [Clostridium perfringens]